MKSYIHFIRHGITEGIQKKWYYGSSDIPLVEEGIVALNEFKDQGIYPVLDDADCYTSGMLRANQTFHVIYGDVPFTPITELREINFGDWEKLTYDQISEKPEHDQWMETTDGSFQFPGGGESLVTFYERIRTGLDQLMGFHRMKELAHRHDGKDAVSIVVCHGGTISASMEHWFPGQRGNFWQWIPATGRGFTVEFENGKPVSFKDI
ncbi:MAG: histidine phosphatase family protein [Firmicutes bacterium]|nr:histidine phosphatase family protein [Bacillota bacterium]